MVMTELRGKVALITGAGRGFGLATAERFAEAGADLALNYRQSQEGCSRVAEQARAFGSRAISVRADITNARDVERMVDQTISQLGRIDILINNAGIMNVMSFVESSEADWHAEMDVNVFGPLRVTRAVLPHMIEQ